MGRTQAATGTAATAKNPATAVLVVEDDRDVADLVSESLEDQGYRATVTASLADSRDHLAHQSCDLVLLDLTLPDGSGFELLDELSADPGSPPVIVLTGDAGIDTAVDAIRRGAHDYVAKPFEIGELLNRIGNAAEVTRARDSREVERRQRTLQNQPAVLDLPSQEMRDLMERAERVAPYESFTVLVRGATGSGKEVISRI